MTFLPIVARELRVASRRQTTYWVRTGAGGTLLLIGAWFLLMMQREPPREVAMVLFGVTTGAAVLYCLFSGVRVTADCVSEEKREGTLGLLFLTDLKGYDVILGKLVANSVNPFYAVMATVPLLAVPLLLGGISGGQFGRMALVAVNTLFFSLSIGICVSAFSRDARRAMGSTFLVLIVLTALLPACAAWLTYARKMGGIAELLYLPSPGFCYMLGFDRFGMKPGAFWVSLAVIHGIGWLGLILASLVVPKTWQDRPMDRGRWSWRQWSHWWKYGNMTDRALLRSHLLKTNAFLWLAARERLRPAYVWAVLGLLGCGWIWGLAKFHRDWLSEGVYVATALILNALIKTWVGSEAGRQLANERQQGTLELLLSTPLSVREILTGQRLALQRQFLGPLAVVLLIMMLFFAACQSDAVRADERPFWTAFWVGAMVMLVADLAALYWVGMWQGLSARNFNRAAGTTFGRILVFPWVMFAAVILLYTLAAMGGGGPEPGWQFLFGLWFFLGIATDIGFGMAARQKLLTEFRVLATRRFEARVGFLRRLLGGE